jgi:hypothetical protein
MSLGSVGVLLAPRVVLAAIWILTDRVDDAFERAAWPALGIAFAPSATILYVLLWTQDTGGGGVTGPEWVIVGIGAAVDAATWVKGLVPPRTV